MIEFQPHAVAGTCSCLPASLQHHQPTSLPGWPSTGHSLFIREFHLHGTEEHLIPPSCPASLHRNLPVPEQVGKAGFHFLSGLVGTLLWCVHSSGLPSQPGERQTLQNTSGSGLQLLWALLALLLPPLPTSPECPSLSPALSCSPWHKQEPGALPCPLGLTCCISRQSCTRKSPQVLGCCQGFSQGISSCSLLPFILPRAACF